MADRHVHDTVQQLLDHPVAAASARQPASSRMTDSSCMTAAAAAFSGWVNGAQGALRTLWNAGMSSRLRWAAPCVPSVNCQLPWMLHDTHVYRTTGCAASQSVYMERSSVTSCSSSHLQAACGVKEREAPVKGAERCITDIVVGFVHGERIGLNCSSF